MKITVYTTTNFIVHTGVDRVEECGGFLCVYEGEIIYKYNISYVTHYIQSPENIEEEL